MGTNFYFKVKVDIKCDVPVSGKLKENILEKLKYALEDATEIHIGKRSGGWYPLFQQTEYFSSVKEIKDFYLENKNSLSIVDEYDMEYSLEQLDKEIFNWNKDNPEARSHLDYCSRYDGTRYYLDSEGYEFTTGEFC